MSAAIDRLLAITRVEGDIPSTERDAVNGAMVHTMTRPMSEEVADAAGGESALSYLQSTSAPVMEGFFDEAADVMVLFPLRAGLVGIGPGLAGRAERKRPAPWFVMLLGVAGVFQLLRAVFGDLSILRMAVGVALITGAVVLWRQRAASSSRKS